MPPEAPPGWGCRFSEKRHRWYFYNLEEPRHTSWTRPDTADGSEQEVAEAITGLMSDLQLQPHSKQGKSDKYHGPARLIIVRHAYRLDEADESWPARALRPQDSPLAPLGVRQAQAIGATLARRDAGVRSPVAVVLSSPFARTVQTAAAIASALGVGLAIEEGLCEDAAHMARNKLCREPWFLPAADLCVAAGEAAGVIDLSYRSLVHVRHSRGPTYPGRPLELESGEEVKADTGGGVDVQRLAQERFYSRCERLARSLQQTSRWKGQAVVLVTHGGVTSCLVRALTGQGVGSQLHSVGTIKHTACTELQRVEHAQGCGGDDGGEPVWTVVTDDDGRGLHSVAHLSKDLQSPC